MAHVNYVTTQFTPGAWAGSDIEPNRMLPGGGQLDPTQFFAPDSQLVTLAAAALAAATTVRIAAVKNPIPNKTVINLGTNKFFVVNQTGGIPASDAEQDVTVLAIPTALGGTETGRYPGVEKVSVPSGVFVGRTFAERDALAKFGPAAFATDDEIFIVAFGCDNVNVNPEVDLILRNRSFVLYENYLPEWDSFDATAKAYVRANWQTTIAEQ